MGEYKSSRPDGDKRPSVEVKLPLGFKYLEAPLNHLINRLDIAEEREKRIEEKVDRLLQAVSAFLGEPEKHE